MAAVREIERKVTLSLLPIKAGRVPRAGQGRYPLILQGPGFEGYESIRKSGEKLAL